MNIKYKNLIHFRNDTENHFDRFLTSCAENPVFYQAEVTLTNESVTCPQCLQQRNVKDRYTVEVRVGCAAIVDEWNYNRDMYPGLSAGSPHVVEYLGGYRVNGEWTVNNKNLADLFIICENMNKENKHE